MNENPHAAFPGARARNLLVLVVTVASIALAARLGFWQLDRAAQKEALQTTLESRGREPALAAADLARRPQDVATQVYRRVVLSGQWLAARTVFLDNRQMREKVGFLVVTPFMLDGSAGTVLVQRGWIARNFTSRATLPEVATPAGHASIEGNIEAAPARLFEFSAVASGPIRQNVDAASFARETGLPLLPLAIVESATTANAHDGLERHWSPPATNVQMHYGYAFQWFAIGAVILFLYVRFRILRPDNAAVPDPALLSFSVHSLPVPSAAATDRVRTRRGRWQMLAVLVVCLAPVVASYLAFFGWRPQSLTNYSELILPPRPLPADLLMRRLNGARVLPNALRGQWLLVVVAGGACDPACERHLWLQRQLHETLGAEKDRVDKVWIVDDGAEPREATLYAIGAADARMPASTLAPATVLRVEKAALASWLEPAGGRALEDHLYIVDPRGDWMMRAPPEAQPARLKRDIDKLLRASAGWDRPGR